MALRTGPKARTISIGGCMKLNALSGSAPILAGVAAAAAFAASVAVVELRDTPENEVALADPSATGTTGGVPEAPVEDVDVAAAPPSPGPEEAAASDMPPPVPPRFDQVRVAPDGATVVAGRGAADAEVTLRLDGADVAVAETGFDGTFAALLTLPASDAPSVLSLSLRLPDGRVVDGAESVIVAPIAGPAPTGMAEAPDAPEMGDVAALAPTADAAPGVSPTRRPDLPEADALAPDAPETPGNLSDDVMAPEGANADASTDAPGAEIASDVAEVPVEADRGADVADLSEGSGAPSGDRETGELALSDGAEDEAAIADGARVETADASGIAAPQDQGTALAEAAPAGADTSDGTAVALTADVAESPPVAETGDERATETAALTPEAPVPETEAPEVDAAPALSDPDGNPDDPAGEIAIAALDATDPMPPSAPERPALSAEIPAPSPPTAMPEAPIPAPDTVAAVAPEGAGAVSEAESVPVSPETGADAPSDVAALPETEAAPASDGAMVAATEASIIEAEGAEVAAAAVASTPEMDDAADPVAERSGEIQTVLADMDAQTPVEDVSSEPQDTNGSDAARETDSGASVADMDAPAEAPSPSDGAGATPVEVAVAPEASTAPDLPQTADAPAAADIAAAPEAALPDTLADGDGPEAEIAAAPDTTPSPSSDVAAMPAAPAVPEITETPSTAPAADRPRVVTALPAPDAPEAPALTAAVTPTPAPSAELDAGPAPSAPAVVISGPEGLRVMQAAAGAPQVQTEVRLDAIGYDITGGVILTGRGPADRRVEIALDDRPVRMGLIAGTGDWTLDLPDVDPGTYRLSVRQLSEEGRVETEVETPFLREDPARIAAAPAPEAGVSVITVQPDFTLWGMAEDLMGDGMAYLQIFEANRDRIRDPHWIYPGQIFRLPEGVSAPAEAP